MSNSLYRLLASLGVRAGLLASYLVRHPWFAVFAMSVALSGFIGWLIVILALLVQPMNALFLVLWMVTAPAAVFSVQRDRLLSRRLWIAMLANVIGLLSFRVIYYDLLHLDLDPVFRSNCIGIFGLVCGVTGFLRIR